MVDVGQTFQIKPGEQASLKGSPLRVVFERVVQDSRCPRGEQCLVAGTATVRMVVEGGAAGPVSLDLRIPDRPSMALPTGTHLVLLRLDPYPVSGRPTPPGSHQATLAIRTSGTDAER